MTPIFWVYILQSETTSETYVGQTADLERRLAEHNDLENRRTLHTKRRKGPWKLLHSETFATRVAMKRERELKSGVGREWIRRELLKLSD
jgi:putative endonuclease